MPQNFVDAKNARKGEYKKVIEEIAKTGKCPFCKENFKYHKKPTYKTKGSWFLTNNSWPYKNAGCHLIIIGKKHKENFKELTKKDLEEVSYLTNWAIKKWGIKGGALAIRFGETAFTGASVSHLHFHIISPELNKKTQRAKTVEFPIG
ncbi:MAG: HIT domain-containing protein [Candidatus Wildermuthbacteria bacterium]|nr:HIT domain-containing protein [Candidatus Wildermuthbacteria bacterium]